MRQDERRARTRGALLRAASAAFAEHGYDGASLDAIAAAADLSKGAVYAHFETKRDLYLAVTEKVLEEGERRLQAVCAALGASAAPEVAAASYFDGAASPAHVSHVTDLWQVAIRDEQVGRALSAFRDRRRALLAGAAVDAGSMPAGALGLAEMVAKLIDADTLYGRLGEASRSQPA